jgi:hypothetical protein
MKKHSNQLLAYLVLAFVRRRSRRNALALSIGAFFWSVAAPMQAKPLSYVGGTMVMQETMKPVTRFLIDYTFNPHFTGDLFRNTRSMGRILDGGPHERRWIKRWNLPDGRETFSV